MRLFLRNLSYSHPHPPLLCLFSFPFLFITFFSFSLKAEPLFLSGEKLDSHFDFYYIEANVGVSSGGHSALRMGDTVYHFQYYPDKIFRLERESYEAFHREYALLENRSLHAHRVAVTSRTLKMLRDRFELFHLVQNRQLAVDDALKERSEILASFQKRQGEGGSTLNLLNLGFFAEEGEGEDPDVERLTGLLRLGDRDLKRRIKKTEQRIASLKWSRPPVASPERFLYPHTPYLDSQRYGELILRREALRILLEKRGLRDETLLSPPPLPFSEKSSIETSSIENPSGEMSSSGEKPYGEGGELTSRERRILEGWSGELLHDIRNLLQKDRPGAARALLLQMGRYLAIRRGLREGRLLLLDPFPEGDIAMPASRVKKIRKKLPPLLKESFHLYEENRRELFASGLWSESSYNSLENAAARYLEIRRGMEGGPIRIHFGRMIPSQPAKLPTRIPDLPEERIASLREGALRQSRLYHKALTEIYSYNLIKENCATELFRTLNSTFGNDPEVSDAGLGGHIEAEEGLTFVPYLASRKVDRRYRVSKVLVIPSYRKEMLKKIYGREPKIRAYLRESNTLTSTLYEYERGDSWFLFFTDDVVAPRPLYGLVNLVVGVGQTLYGIPLAPFDRGKNFIEGLRGTIFSFPELVFINIRKGSFHSVDGEIPPSATPAPLTPASSLTSAPRRRKGESPPDPKEIDRKDPSN